MSKYDDIPKYIEAVEQSYGEHGYALQDGTLKMHWEYDDEGTPFLWVRGVLAYEEEPVTAERLSKLQFVIRGAIDSVADLDYDNVYVIVHINIDKNQEIEEFKKSA